MGAAMAANLAGASVPLMVYDVDSRVTAGFQSVATSISELAQNSSTIITMLPAGTHVQEVYLSPKTGILACARKGSLLIDCSTIDQETAQAVGRLALSAGMHMIDAPVSGGTAGAKAGTLTFMVGGSKDAVDAARPVLGQMGKSVVHCGNVGSGQVAKICNNLLLAISMAGTAEAMALGERLGMDPNILALVINSSSGRCWASEQYNPVPGITPNSPASRDYTGGFSVRLMAKDTGLACAAATKEGLRLSVAEAVKTLYASIAGDPQIATKDFSIVYKLLGRTPPSRAVDNS